MKTGPKPTDRGETDSKFHLLCDSQGPPLTCAFSAANVNDGDALKPLVRGTPAVRSRRGPRRWRPAKLHADKAHHSRDQRRWPRERQIGVRIARPGAEPSQRLGRHQYKIGRSLAWLGSYRR